MTVDAPEPSRAELLRRLADAQSTLNAATAHYGRELAPELYWWLGVSLAASVLAQMNGQETVAVRLEAGVDSLIENGITPDRTEQVINELAIINSLGLLWPLYRREADGWVRQAEVAVASGFGPSAAYWLALAHLAVALSPPATARQHAADLAEIIGELVTGGAAPAHHNAILAVLDTAAHPHQ